MNNTIHSAIPVVRVHLYDIGQWSLCCGNRPMDPEVRCQRWKRLMRSGGQVSLTIKGLPGEMAWRRIIVRQKELGDWSVVEQLHDAAQLVLDELRRNGAQNPRQASEPVDDGDPFEPVGWFTKHTYVPDDRLRKADGRKNMGVRTKTDGQGRKLYSILDATCNWPGDMPAHGSA